MVIVTTVYLNTYWLYILYVIVHLIIYNIYMYVLFWPHGIWLSGLNKLSYLVLSSHTASEKRLLSQILYPYKHHVFLLTTNLINAFLYWFVPSTPIFSYWFLFRVKIEVNSWQQVYIFFLSVSGGYSKFINMINENVPIISSLHFRER